MIRLTGVDLELVLYCCSAELRARRRGKPPGVGRRLDSLVRRLELEVAVSRSRQESEGVETDSGYDDDEWIGTREAARLLRWNVRKVQRRKADLDGREVAGQLIFPARAVREYDEALTDGRNLA